jgi:hydrogenase large subunit
MSTRRIVGPFNRVEGDLEITLDIADGRIAAAYVNSPLYRGFEQILQGKLPADALVLVPRICGICSVAQSAASALALADAAGIAPPPNGRLAANLTLATENLADHLTHFYLFFMPDFARADYAGRPWHAAAVERFKATVGSAPHQMLPVRARFMQMMGLLAGKWPHTLAVQPGGSTRPLQGSEIFRLHRSLREFRGFLETVTFGAKLEEVAAIASRGELESWCDKPGGGDLRAFLAIAEDLDLWHLGRGTDRFMSYGCYSEGACSLPGYGTAGRQSSTLPPSAKTSAMPGMPPPGCRSIPPPAARCRWRRRRAPIPGARRRAWRGRWWKPAPWRARW